MATVIDALLVTLGLDNREFKKGEEEAEKAYGELVKKAAASSKAIVDAAQSKASGEVSAAKASTSSAIEAAKAKAKGEMDAARGTVSAAQGAEFAKAKAAEESMNATKHHADKVYDDLVKKARDAAKQIIAAAQGKSKEEQEAAKEAAAGMIAAEKKAALAIKNTIVSTAKETADKVKEQSDRGKEFFKGMTEAAMEFFGIMMAAGAMVEFVKGTMEAEIGAGRLAKTLNVDVEELEAMQGAVKRVGGTTEGLDSSLKGLNSRLEMIAIHGPRSAMALKVFAGLGISEVALKGKNAIATMGLLSEKMTGMSEAKAMALGEKLGLDEGTVRLLKEGKEGMADLIAHQKALGVASKEEGEQSEKMEHAMLDFKDSASTVGRELMSALMPSIIGIAHALAAVSGWMSAHGDTVKMTLLGIGTAMVIMNQQAIAGAAAVALKWLATIPSSIAAGLGFTAAGEAAVEAETAATLGLNWIVIAIEAAIVGLYELIKHWKEVKNWAEWVAYDVVFFWLKAFFTIERGAVKTWKAFKDAAMAPLEWVWNKLKAIGDLCASQFKFIGKLLHGDVKGAVNVVKGAVNDVTTIAGMQPAFAGAPNAGAAQSRPMAPVSAGMALRPSSVSNSHSTTTVSRETHVSIGTVTTQATDAQGLAKELPGAIKSRSSLVDNFDGGF